jgi:hypothetical protein
MSHHEQVYV